MIRGNKKPPFGGHKEIKTQISISALVLYFLCVSYVTTSIYKLKIMSTR